VRRAAFAVAVLIAGCEGCGAGNGGGSIPDAIRSFAQHREVEPWSGWSVPGVTLYRVSFAVPDRSESSIVGLDTENGGVLAGAALMRRIETREPALLASRAFDVLLASQGSQPLTPEQRSSLGTDEEWAEVRPARIEGTVLVFWAFRGEMAPELVEHRVDTERWELTTRTAIDVIVASGRRATYGGERCLPRSSCGCWQGCARYEPVRVPGRDRAEVLLVIVGQEAGGLFVQRHDCTTVEGRETCARICDADHPQATCHDAVVSEEEGCSEACPPSEALYHCELVEGGCRQVDHPIRRAAAGR
jgi:hypothetical protein